jgi:3D-(3,5/4)-trihydroxycyclohexane-1,2-dione acylhydrolase (decyclizing)
MDEIATISEPRPLSKRSAVRLTTAQALIRYLAGLRTRLEAQHREETVPLFGGVFAIFGHGNVAGIGEALYQYRDRLPTYRGHNEQAMAHAAS